MSTETNGKQTVFVVIGIIGAIATLVTGAAVIFDLRVENAVLKATQTTREELAAIRGANAANEALLNAKLVEIETQFRAEDQMRNVQWADQRRLMALLWQKEFGAPYPSEIQFYPSVAK